MIVDQHVVRTDSIANAASSTPTLRAAGRKALFWGIAGVGAILVSVAATLIAGGSNAGGRTLAADNPAQAGGMALVEVLRQQGVTVTLANNLDEARAAADLASDPTLFFHDEQDFLNERQLAAMAELTPRTVVAAPNFLTLQTLAPDVGFGGVSDAESLAASCAVPAAVKAGTLSPGGSTLTLIEPDAVQPDASGHDASGQGETILAGCFPSSENAFSLIERAASGRTITLIADASAFTNAQIATWGNAALALNLLGESDTLIWYLPTIIDVPQTGPPSIGELTPGWVTPTLVLLVLVALAAFIWRGRRFGPLIAENLPVTVKASETMEGRSRLYARGNARLRAIDALRIGAVARLAKQVGRSSTASLDDIVLAIAAITERSPEQVRAVIVDSVPASDRDLIALSDQLRELEQATSRATAPHQNVPQSHEPRPHDPQPHGRMDP